MRLTRVAGPTIPPVSLDELKSLARIEHSGEDLLLEGLIASTTARLDGPEGLLGRCLLLQTWEVTVDHFPRWLTLPLPSVRSVVSITYEDASGAPVTVDPGAYAVAGLDDHQRGAAIALRSGQVGPAERVEAVHVRFTAGYGDAPEDVPEPIREAIKVRALARYENRESAGAVWTDDLFEYRVAGC